MIVVSAERQQHFPNTLNSLFPVSKILASTWPAKELGSKASRLVEVNTELVPVVYVLACYQPTKCCHGNL